MPKFCKFSQHEFLKMMGVTASAAIMTKFFSLFLYVTLLALVSGCGPTPPPTATPILPTATPMPPTPTPLPATDTVCADSCDFTTIQAAIDDPGTTDGAIIEITDPIHTEAGIIVSKDVTIRGLGADKTIVQAHVTLEEAPDRVFLIEEGATVTIRDLTIRHGNPPMDDEDRRCGGGIANKGTLTLENCVVSHNTGNNGGGIWNCNGTLTVVNCTISHNTADRIAPDPWEDGFGGGIELQGKSTLTLVNSTVSDNEAKSCGGGIYVAYETTATLTNCTISGNWVTTYGGGLYTEGVLHLTHCTVVNNQARAERAFGQIGERVPKDRVHGGGGVYVKGDTLHFMNTIIANSGKGDCFIAGPDGYGISGSLGTNSNNLVEDGSCDAAYSGDPMLGPLADNGGATWTHALLPDSPAIDAVSVVSCTVPTDQRGVPRPIVQTSSDTPCDIGAFERQTE